MTNQIEEKIIINNEELMLKISPIETLIKKNDSNKDFKPIDVPKKKEYSAEWKIKDNVLYLKSIDYHKGFKLQDELNSYLFRHMNGWAYWYSGLLIVDIGKPLWYREGKYPVYEKEIIFQVQDGIITDNEEIENEIPF